MALRLQDVQIGAVSPAPKPRIFSPQERDNWCWAACCSMALAARGQSRAQCNIANSFFNNGNVVMDCCLAKACDFDCPIPKVAGVFRTNGLGSATLVPAQRTQADLISDLARSTVAVGLQGSPNHMVLVERYTGSGSLFMVADPAVGEGAVPFAELQQSSSPQRTWTWTWTDLR
jgi:hypothetical protein